MFCLSAAARVLTPHFSASGASVVWLHRSCFHTLITSNWFKVMTSPTLPLVLMFLLGFQLRLGCSNIVLVTEIEFFFYHISLPSRYCFEIL
jgi:hypothetical protein